MSHLDVDAPACSSVAADPAGRRGRRADDALDPLLRGARAARSPPPAPRAPTACTTTTTSSACGSSRASATTPGSASPRSASSSRTRPLAPATATRFRSTSDPDRADARSSTTRSPGSTARSRCSAARSTASRRWSTEAEGRRAHLAGPPRARSGRGPSPPRTRHAPRTARDGRPMTVAPLAALPRRCGAMRHRNYRLFFVGQADLAGRHLDAAGRPGWLVLQLTARPALAGPRVASPSSGR